MTKCPQCNAELPAVALEPVAPKPDYWLEEWPSGLVEVPRGRNPPNRKPQPGYTVTPLYAAVPAVPPARELFLAAQNVVVNSDDTDNDASLVTLADMRRLAEALHACAAIGMPPVSRSVAHEWADELFAIADPDGEGKPVNSTMAPVYRLALRMSEYDAAVVGQELLEQQKTRDATRDAGSASSAPSNNR